MIYIHKLHSKLIQVETFRTEMNWIVHKIVIQANTDRFTNKRFQQFFDTFPNVDGKMFSRVIEKTSGNFTSHQKL